jgi:hypothetical protein
VFPITAAYQTRTRYLQIQSADSHSADSESAEFLVSGFMSQLAPSQLTSYESADAPSCD